MAHQADRTPDLPYLMTADELGEFLRRSRRAIYTMKDRGQLPRPVRIGRRVLFRRNDVLEWLDAKLRAPSSSGGRR